MQTLSRTIYAATGILTATCLTLIIANPAFADIYRVVDKDGNVVYTDQKPKDGAAQNIEEKIEQASQANTSESPETVAEKHPEWLKKAHEEQRKEALKNEQQRKEEERQNKEDWQKAYSEAKQALKAAERAKEEGVEVRDGDFIGKAGGGTRPSGQYIERQRALEQAVIEAKAEVARLKKIAPDNPPFMATSDI